MVHVDEMRDFVRDDVSPGRPAVRGSAASCSGCGPTPSSCPSACPHRRRIRISAVTPARSATSAVSLRQERRRARRLRKRLDAPRKAALWTAANGGIVSEPRRARVAGSLHCKRDVTALDRDRRARRRRAPPASIAPSCASTHSRCSAAQASAALRFMRERAGQLQHAPFLVEPQAKAPRAAHAADLAPGAASPRGEARPQSERSMTWSSSSSASASLTVQPRVDWPASCTVSRLPEIR